jgi:hypothetical protein
MALVIADRVFETTTTTGTGAVALGGAVSGFRTFGSGIGNSNTTYYTIAGPSEWEVGLGTLDGTSANLTRTTVYASSNSGAAVNFSAGTKNVFCTYTATRGVYLDASGNVGIGTTSPTQPLTIYNSTNTTGAINVIGDGNASVITQTRYSNDTAPPQFAMQKAAGTFASPTVVTNGWQAGQWTTRAFAGSNFRTVTNILGVVDTVVSDTNISGYLTFNTNGGGTGTTERMRVHASGGVSVGNTTDPGATNLSVTGSVTTAQLTVNGSNVNTTISPTGTGTVTINPAGASTINNTSIGATTRSTGAFTTLGANSTVNIDTTTNNQSYTTTGAGAITMTSGTAGNINNMNIGATTAGTGAFTSITATSKVDTGIFATNAGLSANTTVNNTTTYTTAGITLANQTADTGRVWRIRAYGQFTAANSGTARTARIACFWGTTQLVAITPTVLTSTAQTTQWQVEFELVGTSTTAIWTTGTLMSRVSSSTTGANPMDNATPASTAVTAGAQTLDLRVSMSASVAGDSWIIQQVTMERLD